VKIRGGVGEISLLIVEALPLRPNLRNIFDFHYMAAEHGGLIKKRKRKFTGKT